MVLAQHDGPAADFPSCAQNCKTAKHAGRRRPGDHAEQHIALALMRNTGAVSNEMLRAWGIESHAATSALRGLVDQGLALKSGGRRYASYELIEVAERQMALWPSVPVPGPVVTGRRARIDRELQAVVEAVRAGHMTVRAVSQQLDLDYTTTTRRINRLLETGRIEATAAPHTRGRSFVIREPASLYSSSTKPSDPLDPRGA